MDQNKIWNFKSESTPGKIYIVQELDNKLICNCLPFASSKDGICRHIRLIKNGLVNTAVVQEPDLVAANVRKVIMDGNKILVPTFEGFLEKLKTIYELRQLGISKKRCAEWFNFDYGSDKKIELALRQAGYFRKAVKVSAFVLVGWSR